MQMIVNALQILRQYGQKFGPYLMVEVVLPGGTLIALLLFLYQRRKLREVNGVSLERIDAGSTLLPYVRVPGVHFS